MTRLPLVLAMTLLGAGCVESLVPSSAGVSDWSFETEPSMAPDFTGQGESFPVLLVHLHHLPSERQREAWRNVVCATTDEERPLLELRPRAEMAAAMCAAPPADAATGRLYLERDEFEAQRPEAVVVTSGTCGGSVVVLDAARRDLEVTAPGHTFLVERHDNRTFSVDGRWIAPGTALKASYFIARGSEKDEEFVRIVFDHPGEWLKSRVAPWSEALDGDVPPRPDEGSGLVVEVPLATDAPLDVVEATLAATPGTVERIETLRLVHDGERLTEATVRYGTSEGPVTWYGAGRTGDSVRMLGARDLPSDGHGVAPDALRAAFADATWATLRGPHAGPMTDVRLDTTSIWATAGVAPLALDPSLAPCEDACVMLLHTDALGQREWRTLVAPQKEETYDALTLHALALGDAADEAREVWWHVPR